MADVLNIACGQLGVTESPAGSNRTKYGKWMGLDGQPWCMSFVQWCFHQAGTPLPHRTGSCSALLNWYKANRPECVVKDPQPGDIAIFTFGHTGIVERALPGSVMCIEGNTSPGQSGSQDNGGGVYRRQRNLALVRAFIRPFPKKEDIMTGKEIYDALSDYLSRQTVPNWAKKELEEAVKMGITDGSNPMQLIPRYQAVILAKRAAEGK
ncbi:MAG: CHAP domain-containing protein [Oscillospiraceae bacterium]|jgi:hypothetical protein|nr:CHAP domain-containing protein [Oscillospiraceae bacterium]